MAKERNFYKPLKNELLEDFLHRCELSPETGEEGLEYWLQNFPRFYKEVSKDVFFFQDIYGNICVFDDSGTVYSIVYSHDRFMDYNDKGGKNDR